MLAANLLSVIAPAPTAAAPSTEGGTSVEGAFAQLLQAAREAGGASDGTDAPAADASLGRGTGASPDGETAKTEPAPTKPAGSSGPKPLTWPIQTEADAAPILRPDVAPDPAMELKGEPTPAPETAAPTPASETDVEPDQTASQATPTTPSLSLIATSGPLEQPSATSISAVPAAEAQADGPARSGVAARVQTAIADVATDPFSDDPVAAETTPGAPLTETRSLAQAEVEAVEPVVCFDPRPPVKTKAQPPVQPVENAPPVQESTEPEARSPDGQRTPPVTARQPVEPETGGLRPLVRPAEVPAETEAQPLTQPLEPAHAEHASDPVAAGREGVLSTLSRATIDTTAAIAAHVIRSLEGRSTRFEMALTPEDLGRVDVSLEIDADGQLAARLAFDNPAAAVELRGRADELRRQLEDAGFRLGQDSLQFADREPSDRRQSSAEQARRAFAGAGRVADEAETAAPSAAGYLALSLNPDRLDVRI